MINGNNIFTASFTSSDSTRAGSSNKLAADISRGDFCHGDKVCQENNWQTIVMHYRSFGSCSFYTPYYAEYECTRV